MTQSQRGRHYSRAHYRRGNLDFAYFCGHCGEIRLGSPSVDPRTPPDPPSVRCRTCHHVEWLESVVPALDPSALDADMGRHLRARRTFARSQAPRSPLPDYYSVDTLDPNPDALSPWHARRKLPRCPTPTPKERHV